MRRELLGLIFRLAGALAFLFCALASAAPLSTAVEHESAIGRSTETLQESQGRLDLSEALAAYHAGRFTAAKSPVLNFGIGAKPVWIHVRVDNPTQAAVHRRLSVETAWLDHVDVYLLHQDRPTVSYRLGDRQPFRERPLSSRYFVLDEVFAPGTSDLFIRVETPDPMVVPIYLLTQEASRVRQLEQELSYGVVYGFLLALMAYNAILFFSLRSTPYLFYSAYLAMFIAMNVSYTGHGFAWIWPDSLRWAQWSNPVLIFLYGASGLLFAIRFLDLRVHFPRVRRIVLGYCATAGALLGAAVLLGSQKFALLVAFGFVFVFTGVMLALGAMTVRAGQRVARYFLVAALCAMAGAVLTTLSTWGFIPHNSWTFRAVEIGMLFDATLLAMALGYQFRVGQEERLRAERLAQLDPLTGLNNRRAFYDLTTPLWSAATRHGHDTSIVLLDIDLFKLVNDTRGHAHGDRVLRAIAETLREAVRQEDVLARWGGEEFIVFLPETSVDAATRLAERLRAAVAAQRIPYEDGAVSTVTASFGVAQKNAQHPTLDALIASADACLYQSKEQGRNRVTVCPRGGLSAAA